MPRGRPKGSKNKTKSKISMSLSQKAQYFADLFIMGESINEAEILTAKILEKIRASKKHLQEKYGDEENEK